MKKYSMMMLLFIAGLLLAVGCCTIIAFNCHVSIIYLGLRSSVTTLVSIRSMVTILLTKLLTETILLVAGVYCILLHFQSPGERSFMQMSCAFILGAGIVITLMDYKVIFYASPTNRRIWQHCADVYVLMLSALIQWTLLWDYNELPHRKYLIPYALAHAVLGMMMIGSTIIRSEELLLLYSWLMWGMAGLRLLRMLGRSFSWLRLLRLTLMLVLNAFVMLVARSKLNPMDDIYKTYLDWSPYFLTLYLHAVFALCFHYQRKSTVLSRTELRRLEDVQAYLKTLSSNIIRNTCNLLDSLSRKIGAASSPEADGDIRERLSEAARQTADSLSLLELYDFRAPLDTSQVSLKLFFQYVKRLMRDKDDAPEFTLHADMPRDYTVLCDYALMAKACVTLVYRLCELSEDGQLAVQAYERDGRVHVRLLTETAPESIRNVKRLRRTLRTVSSTLYDVTDEDLSLILALRIFAAHGTALQMSCSRNRIQLQWELTACHEEESVPAAGGSAEASANDHAVHIALISTSATQTSLVASCLAESCFCLHTFRRAEKLCEFLRLNRVNVVIVGAMTVSTSAYEVCSMIRSNFSLGELPIILIRKGSVLSMESWFIQVVNDVLREPFSYTELSQRVLSLSMLQRSTHALKQLRLEFLQSQMNPHFIFNAISAIMPLCITNPQKAYSLLGSFSEYLRGNLFPKQSSTPTPVYEELDLVRAYLALENARYQDRIQCRIEEAYDEAAVLYPMLIEPLVENSVKHGLRRDEPSLPLHIDVIVRQENGMLDISVQDDGCGFDVTSFQHEDGVSCNHRSVGLSNLNARLRLHYGVSLSIESQIGQGTRIAFRIPAYAKERGGRP